MADRSVRAPLQSMPSTEATHDLDDDLKSRVWPYAPSADLPQMILWPISSEDGRISGVFWTETMGMLGMGFRTGLTKAQLKRMAQWLERWVAHEPERFTAQGLDAVQRMLRSVARCHDRISREQDWHGQCESSAWDHLL